jgi:hypothetical protein
MHIFANYSVDPDKLLEKANLKSYVVRAREIAETPEAIFQHQVGEYKDYQSPGSWSPKYFGSAIEFLAECYFEFFGALYNLQGIRSVDDIDSTETDRGVDHFATTMTKKIGVKASKMDTSGRVAEVGSPVYIQTKGTLNFKKEFTTNDGARLPNFFMHAFGDAIRSGTAYQSRYILFTTGKSIHRILAENSGQMLEIVNYNEISRKIDGNEDFFNSMRRKLKVAEHERTSAIRDAEYRAIVQQIENNCVQDGQSIL